MSVLRRLGYEETIYLHGAQVKLVELYEQFGVDLGHWRKVSEVEDKKSLAGKLVIAPPSALADKWSRKCRKYEGFAPVGCRSEHAPNKDVWTATYHF
ncbi:MAG: hypothetical protein CM15mP120_10030 [Pseudomonadota bacterium]|nr:MAG: hypothetical protein CM15mP120_10030 [Pseudomonadota bacterium]